MREADDDSVMMEIAPAPARRAFALAALYGLGLLLVATGVTGGLGAAGTGMLWVLGLLGAGAASFWAGERLRRATRLSLRLTREGLSDSSGRMLARWD